MRVPSTSTGVAITNPLVLYRSLLATKRIDADPAQHRLAIRLGQLYDELIDYEPIVQYGHKLNQISKALGTTPGTRSAEDDAQTRGTRSRGILSSLWQRNGEQQDSMALTRVLTNHEAAMQIQSPRGLMLHGEVGTGKSMLIDLFADCLPNRKKRRFHYTTFMLETMAKLEHLRRSRHTIVPASMGQGDDYSLLWLARELISTSPILFLDEFQLPDRAASKIMTNLMTSFFHLGGVLIMSSNRMPEELAKASGMDFSARSPTRMEVLGRRFGMGGKAKPGKSEGMFSTKGDLENFVEVLKARCEVWEMEGKKDYRRRESEVAGEKADSLDEDSPADGFEGFEAMTPGNVGLGYEQSLHVKAPEKDTTPVMVGLPKHFIVSLGEEADEAVAQSQARWNIALNRILGTVEETPTEIPFTPSSMRVYGRTVVIPRQHNGTTQFSFAELCGSPLGPADYITLASTYHTLILTDVPILTTLHKNEARRFITLLDALYEARCKLLVSAAAGPDDLFFPDSAASAPNNAGETVDQDAVYSETISEVYQDATAPFRPNISLYDPSIASPTEPDFTHARLAGMFDSSEHQLEDEPFHNGRHSSSSSNHNLDSGDGLESLAADANVQASRAAIMTARGPDFSQAGIFTGEDEKFAYKRARSRLWEMCGERWWARNEEGWHKPVEASVRRWERSIEDVARAAGAVDPVAEAEAAENSQSGASASRSGIAGSGVGDVRELNEKEDELMFKFSQNARPRGSPFRTSAEAPPKIGDEHVWGVVKGWGKKAGTWGKGTEGVGERREERERGKREDEEEAKRREKEREEKLREWKREH